MATKAILVVDTNPALGELLARILKDEGYEVATVQSLPEAVAALSNSRFDLVITEAFGQTDQFEFDPAFLAELRSAANEVPIVLCSTYPSADTLRAGDYQLAEILPKPFTIDGLLRKVNKLLTE